MKTQNIKAAKVTGSFINTFTGRNSSSSFVAINENGEYGFLPNNDGSLPLLPYTPIGGRSALKSVVEQNCLIFKSFNYGDNYTVGKAINL